MVGRQHGFSYLIALFLVAALSLISLRGLQRTATNAQRDKEALLLEVGKAYYEAIRIYYDGSPGSAKTYPKDLAALLLDSRSTQLRRPLRKLYPDPISGSANWGLIAAPDGGVMGVYSMSTQKPIKVAGFEDAFAGFTGAKRYQDWQFVYKPK